MPAFDRGDRHLQNQGVGVRMRAGDKGQRAEI
ncbi:hypothetical protein ACVWXM_001359 [Bradyrhizobium sp. GM7.3]